ncbi:hypothetical protein EDB83DRAFT_2343911 [Lactarius deliciosus]|nr:hypothetical protein EDB83DRAFT_2343911 [Lactarius deliciosus]
MTWAASVRVPVFKVILARSQATKVTTVNYLDLPMYCTTYSKVLVIALMYDVWHPLFRSGKVSGHMCRFPRYLLFHAAPLMSIIHKTVPFQLLDTRIYLSSMVDQLRSPRPVIIAAADKSLVTNHRLLVTEDNKEPSLGIIRTILTLPDSPPSKFENITLFFK